MMPMTVPMVTVISVAVVAMMSEIRRPYRSWAKMSRPGAPLDAERVRGADPAELADRPAARGR